MEQRIETPGREVDAETGTSWALPALAAGAAAIHLAMVPSHMDAWAVEGVAFTIVGWLQLSAAVILLRRPTHTRRQVVAIGSALLVVAWVVSRTTGLPVGPDAGVAEDVTIVDLTCVALQVALIAGVLLVPRVRARSSVRRPSSSFWRPAFLTSFLVPVLAIGMTSVAIASPSARDHANGHTDPTQGHTTTDQAAGVASLANGHTHPDDFLPYAPMTVAAFHVLGEQLAAVREVTLRYPTVGDALRAGFVRRGAFIPGQGAHLFPPPSVLASATNSIERPLSWLYSGLEDTSVVVGVMYGSGVDFAGPNDRWHFHTNVCVARVPSPDGGYETYSEGEGMTPAQCAARNGSYIANAGPLMHVWAVPGWESPIGVFSHDNPLVVCTDGKKPSEVAHSTGGCKGLS
jgi:hypothetical protein